MHRQWLSTLQQNSSPFVERLALSTAELDPGALGLRSDSLFGASSDQDSSEALQAGVVGSIAQQGSCPADRQNLQ